MDFLNANFVELTEKLEEWTAKSEEKTEEKQQELDDLKAARAKDLDRLAKLKEKLKECQQVVHNDRKRREKARETAQTAVRELAAAIRIQAWWRGMMVRHKIGYAFSFCNQHCSLRLRHRSKSKGKGKKGKKGSKKKKKK